MPRARNRVASSPEQVEEAPQEMEQDGGKPLQFDEPLTWRPGKQIQVTDLLRRLKSLSEELESIDQEDAHRGTLVPKAQELANQQLLGHKDKGVKAYTMVCIAEMFRLLAPDAPYKGGQMKEIFTLFTSTIVPALANSTDSYGHQHNTVLQSLTTVKSVVLITDIPGSDHVILNLFTNCFDVMSGGNRSTGERLPKNLEYHMTNMLCTLVDECETLPAGVIEQILAQFLRANPEVFQSTGKKSAAKPSEVPPEVSPAYSMARSICNVCADKMAREIGKYFGAVLIDASETVATSKGGKPRGKKRTHDESEDESDDGLLTPPAETDLEEVEKAHRLLRELWRSSPDVIQNVVPQVEAEIEAELPQLRTMAIQTLGDMIAGIGAAGPPPPTILDPAAYPSQSLEDHAPVVHHENVLLEPKAPHAFSSFYREAYKRFSERFKDKSPLVRSAWATEVGRIILTSGGGKGLEEDQEKALLGHLAGLLMDVDEKVRLSAVQAISTFDFQAIVQKIGKSGGVTTPGSVLCNLSDRIKDPKPHVRNAAMELLGRIWGVAAGAIAEGNERTRELLGAIPSKIFEAVYINDREINALVQRVLFESLLPVSYPPIKRKQPGNGDSQRVNDSQATAGDTLDPDAIRAERILVLVRDLEHRAKNVFFGLQRQQAQKAKYLESYLKACEEVNASKGGANAKESQKRLDTLVDAVAGTCANTAIAAEHLKKFAKHHDRRSYQLIRFCYSPEKEYRLIFNAMKELTKRMDEAPSGMADVLKTLMPLINNAAILVYNRSHVPAIVEVSSTDGKGLANAAHEVLKQISTQAPDVFKVHIHELCEALKKHTPTSNSPPDLTIVDTLKACAGFARRFPGDMPKDRDFYKAMVAYAIHGNPPKAAKHAVTVTVSSADKKEMYIKELQQACIKNFKYGEDGFLSKLATMSQLRLLASNECEPVADKIMEIAVNQVLTQTRTAPDTADPEWDDEIDDDLAAKLWALRILVNGLRGLMPTSESEPSDESVKEAADRVYKLLNTLIKADGELSKTATTPQHYKARLRLAAAIQILKLSCTRKFDQIFNQMDFNQLSKIAQDPLPEVRSGFLKALQKYLGAGKLPNRFYALVFLYAFEPNKETLQSAITWLKSRAAMSAKLKDGAMEGTFLRFLSLLAHHQDFSPEPEHLEDFVEYIVFFLKNAATQENLPMLYHLAQRLKTIQDALVPEKSENLYILSDIAQAVIRQYADIQSWSLQVVANKAGLPSGLFQRLPSHTAAREIAEKTFVPEDLADNLEDLVKNSMKTKKRKSESHSTQSAKKAKTTANGTAKLPARKPPKPVKTPKKKKVEETEHSSAARRKSSRVSGAQNYAEPESSEEDEELEQSQEDVDMDDAEEGARQESSTPPTSDPMPAPVPEVKSSPMKELARKKEAAKKKSAEKPVAKMVTPKKLTPQKAATKRAPARTKRATRGNKERDIMDVPSDSD